MSVKMFTRTCFALRNLHKVNKVAVNYSTKAILLANREKPFLVSEPNPLKHNESHIGKLYVVPENVQKELRIQELMDLNFRKQVQAFGKMAIMIRQPAIELMKYLTQTDYTKPINKYVLYGEEGTGKTLTLLHLLHYAHANRHVIISAPWPHEWLIFPKEIAPSPLEEDMYDLPIDAAKWLQTFKSQNQNLLSTLDLKTSKKYEWSSRDKIDSGSPLMELIDFGINRIRYACSVVNALVEEIKIASTENKCRTSVFIDGFNTFFSTYTSVRDSRKHVVPAKRVTLTKAFLSITNHDWCNGVAVLTVERRAVKEPVLRSLPGYLLGTEGFEHLDPFIPIKLENFTHEEFNTMLDYYENRRWLKPLDSNHRAELEVITDRNPLEMWMYCSRL